MKKLLKYALYTCSFSILIIIGYAILCNWDVDTIPVKSQEQLRILSCNIYGGNTLSEAETQKLLATNSDIILIIEWSGENFDTHKFTEAGYSIFIDHPRNVHGMCLLSKINGKAAALPCPVESPCPLPFGMFRFSWNDQSITLIGIHAPPPIPACEGTTADYLNAVSEWIDFGKLNRDKELGHQGDAVILAGDFNALPFSDEINKFSKKGLTQSFNEYTLPTPTWSPLAVIPSLAQIDYIFIPETFKLHHSSRIHIEGSDHLGIVVDLDLK